MKEEENSSKDGIVEGEKLSTNLELHNWSPEQMQFIDRINQFHNQKENVATKEIIFNNNQQENASLKEEISEIIKSKERLVSNTFEDASTDVLNENNAEKREIESSSGILIINHEPNDNILLKPDIVKHRRILSFGS